MAQQTPVDLNQTEPNALTAVADQERAKLIPKNDYNKVGNEYSVVNKDAIADGDSLGRGTGEFLDVYNTTAGTIEDVVERKNEIKINKFNSSKTYPNF
jgi:Na+-translocating ferredoxin:NAD+ oxidoreductase RnfC subunit